jgi:DOPA 4,5-dioxygenase
MTDPDAPWHAHIYYAPTERAAAEALRAAFLRGPEHPDAPVLFVGRMMDQGVGPHPLPQFEIHFRTPAVAAITALLQASGLRALVHPLTDDDLADHSSNARWIGEPVDLDLTTLDPPGRNQGIPRFGVTDF